METKAIAPRPLRMALPTAVRVALAAVSSTSGFALEMTMRLWADNTLFDPSVLRSWGLRSCPRVPSLF